MGLEQSQDRLGRLGGEAQRCRAQSLSGLEHEHVGALLVHVGVGQPGRTVLEDVDHALGEFLSCGDDAQVVGQFAGLGAQCSLWQCRELVMAVSILVVLAVCVAPEPLIQVAVDRLRPELAAVEVASKPAILRYVTMTLSR